jgi:hypothetical protein
LLIVVVCIYSRSLLDDPRLHDGRLIEVALCCVYLAASTAKIAARGTN